METLVVSTARAQETVFPSFQNGYTKVVRHYPGTGNMLKCFRLLTAASSIAAAVLAVPASALTPEALKDQLERSVADARKKTTEAVLLQAVRDFYSKREHRPLWFDGERLSARASAMLDVLARAPEHGLSQATYGMPQLGERARRTDAASQADVELQLTRAYLDYSGDVLSGAVDNPRKVGGTFRDAKRPAPTKLLEDMANAGDPAEFFKRLQPDTRRYTSLKDALAAYRRIEANGGWPLVDKGPTLKPGMKGPRVAQVKRRLSITGDFRDIGGADS